MDEYWSKVLTTVIVSFAGGFILGIVADHQYHKFHNRYDPVAQVEHSAPVQPPFPGRPLSYWEE